MNNWPSYLPTSMTYDDFLTDFQFEDSPEARQAFEQTFNLKSGVDHVPLKNFGFSPPENGWSDIPGLTRPSVNTVTGDEGRWTIGSGASHGGPGSHEGAVQMYKDSLDTDPVSPKFLSTFPGRMSGTELASSYPPPVSVPTGSSGLLSLDAAAGTSLPYSGEGVSESLAAQTAADSATGLSGPQAFAANMALNMIPTRDRKKVSTPFGDEGSASGILKGAGKGALTGATIGSYFGPKGTLIGGVVGGAAGLIGGSQGYFDSTSAPIMNMTRIKRGGGGMRGGLLGGGAMYG